MDIAFKDRNQWYLSTRFRETQLLMTKESDQLSGLKGSKEELNELVAKSASTVSPEQVFRKSKDCWQAPWLVFFDWLRYFVMERANEIGLSQFWLKEVSQYVSKKSQAEEEKMGTIYSKLSSQKLSYPALVFDRWVVKKFGFQNSVSCAHIRSLLVFQLSGWAW